ncbi:MAG: exo-alpha-sialidase [Phycisphaerales bacterium]
MALIRVGARRTTTTLAAAGVALGTSVALAQPLERTTGDAPGRPATRTSPAFGAVADGLFIRQANVNAQQLNIVGDAANEPSIGIDPLAPNRIVIGWRQFDTIASNFRQAGFAWSNDGGRTWTVPGVLTPGVFRSDPVIETASDGTFYYYTLPGGGAWRCEIFRSDDGGRTWSGPVLANGGDRAWMAVDKSRGLGDGNIYGIWNPSFGCCAGGSFGRDTTSGVGPWPTPTVVTPTPIWGTAAVGPDGEVYVAGMSGGAFRVARSDNARDPQQNPAFTSNVAVNLGGPPLGGFGGPNPGGALGQTWVDVNRSSGPSRGHVYVLGMIDPPGADPLDVMFARSTDQGQTWSTPVRVNAESAGANRWNWFSSMSVAPNGRIDVTYNSNHESGQLGINRVYYTFSNDEGQTWSPPEALTPPWDSMIGWPNQNKIGDYYDQESDDVGLFLTISATLNGEQDAYFMRIGDWDCNRNGVGDQQDLTAGTLHDCDGDGVPDECEIAAGAEADANGNGVPDDCECYADCNGSGTLTVADFGCFQGRYVLSDPYADCNASGTLTVADFGCFQGKYVLGCP